MMNYVLSKYSILFKNRKIEPSRFIIIKMKKGFLILSALGLWALSAHAAPVNVCVFDLLGKLGESFKLLEEWALASKQWGLRFN